MHFQGAPVRLLRVPGPLDRGGWSGWGSGFAWPRGSVGNGGPCVGKVTVRWRTWPQKGGNRMASPVVDSLVLVCPLILALGGIWMKAKNAAGLFVGRGDDTSLVFT